MNAVISRIDQAGRISISAQQRRALGLESGTPIVISVIGNELRIRSTDAAMAELQTEAEQFLQNEAASVDAFIARRHSDPVDDEAEAPGHPEPEPSARPEPQLEPEQEAEPEPEPEREHASRPKPRSRR